jgi:hypothetical protein
MTGLVVEPTRSPGERRLGRKRAVAPAGPLLDDDWLIDADHLAAA